MQTQNVYEQKLEAKRERLLARASKKRAEADALHTSGVDALNAIPFGQPILLGHHSEKRDRAYRSRAVGKIDKSFEVSNYADDLERRAESVGTGGISSDDPEAIVKLTAQLEELRATQARMVYINKVHTMYQKAPQSLDTFELTEKERELVRTYVPTYSWIKHPFAPYQLKNNSANIKRIEKRIEEIQRMAVSAEAMSGNGWKISEDAEDNRILVTFDERQPKEIAQLVRHAGFVWSPSRTAWVRKLTSNGRYSARRLAERLTKALLANA